MFVVDCKLVDSNDIRPILGRKACMSIKVIQYTDNDAINKPQTNKAKVYAVVDLTGANTGTGKNSILGQFPQVFSDEVVQLDGEYLIKLKATANAVQHSPRRVPVA